MIVQANQGDKIRVSNFISNCLLEEDRFLPALLQDLTVLVVDDDLDSLDLIIFALSEYKVRALRASSALAALEVIRQAKIDVLVSDIAMPNMDGFSLIRQIRALKPEEGGLIPAIALTAYSFSDEESLLALEQGFQIHLSKPVDLSELIAAVAELANSLKQESLADDK